jgi:hypothetical protein
MSDNFAAHPPSLGEVKANRACDASKWTPRDMLVSLLREIDSGRLKVDAMIVCYRYEGGDSECSYKQSTEDSLVTLGLLSATAAKIIAA